MQKGDHVIVADLSLSLPLRQRPYLGRLIVSGHHDGVVDDSEDGLAWASSRPNSAATLVWSPAALIESDHA